MQDALNRRIGVSLPPQSEEEKAKWILNYTRAMQQEMAELIERGVLRVKWLPQRALNSYIMRELGWDCESGNFQKGDLALHLVNMPLRRRIALAEHYIQEVIR